MQNAHSRSRLPPRIPPNKLCITKKETSYTAWRDYSLTLVASLLDITSPFILICVFSATRTNPRHFDESRRPPFTPKKRRPLGRLFFGAEGGIRTLATVSHTTPLAGEPLEPLGYFCMVQFCCTYSKSYITITHFFALVKAFCREK